MLQRNTEKDNYEKVLEILTSRDQFHIKLGLERISSILELMNNPQDRLNVMHVAGTNGKGSTCAMLASVLSHAGYKTALYTSPHLIKYNERMQINGQEISDKELYKYISEVANLAEKNKIEITEFEILTAAAFKYFYDNGAEYLILETGLGGRLDATNVVKKPILTIITTIDLDHTDRLGNTVELIAAEKAGIIKQDVPVIIAKSNKGFDFVKPIAETLHAEIIIPEDNLYNTYETSLMGEFQQENTALVLCACRYLESAGVVISDEKIREGLKEVNWPARMQYFPELSLVIDGAHNLSGARALRRALDNKFPDKHILWIYSSLNTKDYNSISQLLFRQNDIIICTKSASNSSVDPEKLRYALVKNSLKNQIFIAENIDNALDTAYCFMETVLPEDKYIISIAGSLYSAGEALEILTKKQEI